MSPRPKKPRTCCPHRNPGSLIFKPAGRPMKDLRQVTLELDELEALRLCDSEGLSQLDAGLRMDISRGTVQRLVNSGRKKIIEALLAGQLLLIPAADSVEPKSSLN